MGSENMEGKWHPSQPEAKRPRRSLAALESGLSLSSTARVETTWNASDIAKAGQLLTTPPRPLCFEDEAEMRRVFSVIYDVFRCNLQCLSQLLSMTDD
jgi:hypothetical protein